MPVADSKTITINGQEIKLFYMSKLAFALGRTPQTIRKWEISNVLPKSIFKDKMGRRMYTQEQIDLIVAIAEQTQIKQGLSIANTSFSAKVHRELNKLNKKYLGGN